MILVYTVGQQPFSRACLDQGLHPYCHCVTRRFHHWLQGDAVVNPFDDDLSASPTESPVTRLVRLVDLAIITHFIDS
jgi:hypothetical protein